MDIFKVGINVFSQKRPLSMRRFIYMQIICSLALIQSGCASGTIYVDPDQVPGVGGVVSFPSGKIESIDVRRVISGNSIELTNGEQVVYIGVMIPQINDIPKAARELNRDLLASGEISFEFDEKHRDAKGRLLAYVYTADNRLINAEIIRAGLGQALVRPPNIRCKEILEEAQLQAKSADVGLWSDDFKAN